MIKSSICYVQNILGLGAILPEKLEIIEKNY